MKALPTPKDVRGWESQNNLVIEQNFRQLEEGLRSGYQPLSVTLTTIASDATAAGLALLDDANAAAQRTTLGLGTAAVKNTGTSGNTVPLLDAANSWGAQQAFTTFQVSGIVASLTANRAGYDFTGGAGRLYSLGADAATIGSLNVAVFSSNASLGGTVGSFTSTGLNSCALGATTPSTAAVTTLSITQGAVISGTYTPTLTGVTNVAATTSAVCQYMRVGNVVTVSGAVQVDPTAAAGTALRLSLPVASNLANARELAGTGTFELNYEPVRITGDVANNEALLELLPINTANQILSFHFTYLIV